MTDIAAAFDRMLAREMEFARDQAEFDRLLREGAPMSTELVRRDPGMLSMDQWQIMQQQATILVKTGFLPATIKTPEQAVAVILKGRELGVPPMHALSNIVVIQGKPTCNAELMLALVKRDHGRDAIHITESTEERCTITYQDGSYQGHYSYTIQDAKRAGLLSNQTWQKYPAAMLRARCISAVCRMTFPDSIGGMFTAEELGGPADLDHETLRAPVVVETTNGAPPALTGQQTAPEWQDGAHQQLPAPAPDDEGAIDAAVVEIAAEADADDEAPTSDIFAHRDGFANPTPAEAKEFARLIETGLGLKVAGVVDLLGKPIRDYLQAEDISIHTLFTWLGEFKATGRPLPHSQPTLAPEGSTA